MTSQDTQRSALSSSIAIGILLYIIAVALAATGALVGVSAFVATALEEVLKAVFVLKFGRHRSLAMICTFAVLEFIIDKFLFVAALGLPPLPQEEFAAFLMLSAAAIFMHASTGLIYQSKLPFRISVSSALVLHELYNLSAHLGDIFIMPSIPLSAIFTAFWALVACGVMVLVRGRRLELR